MCLRAVTKYVPSLRGNGSGELIAEGTPEALAHLPHSYTGVYLRSVLERDGALEKAHAS